MAIKHGIWKIGKNPEALETVQMDSEENLEEQIFKDIAILNDGWLLVGRQVRTDFNKLIDLLAIDAYGSLIVIELKKDKTPRDVVAQTIDYASWVKELGSQDVVKIYDTFRKEYGHTEATFDDAFVSKFKQKIEEDEVNSSHQMVVVSAKLDASTERIITYLNDYGSVAINAVFFTVFKDGDQKYLSRTWIIDPAETEEKAVNVGAKGEWNKEYYASYGVSEGHRDWEDARKHGFICAGDGRWYSKTLFNLTKGDRIWVNIPKTGFAGVGIVEKSAVVADQFITKDLEKELSGTYKYQSEVGEDDADYFVAVKWIKTVSEKEAVRETGFFGNQNTVAKPRAAKWAHTVDKLAKLWDIKLS